MKIPPPDICPNIHETGSCPDPVCSAELHAYKRWGWLGYLLWHLGFGPRER